MLSVLERIRELARARKGERFTSLLHHIDEDLLRFAYQALKRDAAPGVDGVTWQDYGTALDKRLADLKAACTGAATVRSHDRFCAGGAVMGVPTAMKNSLFVASL